MNITTQKIGSPSLLVSYVFLKSFNKVKHQFKYRDWALDSGAFSAWNSGKKIEINKYIDTCLELQANDKTLIEIFALDVIGGSKTDISRNKAAEQSLRNTERMWKSGIKAIPTFHVGESEEFLLHITKQYPKIALGGMVGCSPKERYIFCKECFARVWPKKIHGFGECYEKAMLSFPFHSVDASNWSKNVCAFGMWASFGNKHMSMRDREKVRNIKSELEMYLRIERRAQMRWKREMNNLGNEKKLRPDLKLAVLITKETIKALT